ncbi:MAG: hypothetical protein K9K67_01065 [Bacteriovoracaceae bacterium]|nr:hypothetical protein [Bacteriovoracaceae bacterium]
MNKILLILFVLFSCGKNSTESPNKNTSQSPFSLTLKRNMDPIDSFSTDFIKIKESLNQYTLSASLAFKASGSEHLKCTKNGSPIPPIYFQKGSSNASHTLILLKEDSLTINLECLLVGTTFESEGIRIKILKDILIEGDQKIEDLELIEGVQNKIGILYLSTDSSLNISDKVIKITAKTFISEGAKIESFFQEAERVAPKGLHGRHGGEFHLNVEEAFGEVSFNLQGQDGGNFIPSYEGVAKSGNKGRDGNLNGADSGQHCPIFATSGTRGADGKNGVNGLRGGDSGYFIIHSKNQSNLHILSSNLPGIGSQGEQGQEGGLGGAPGMGLTSGFDVFNLIVRRAQAMAGEDSARTIVNNLFRGCGLSKSYTASRGPTGRFGSSGEEGQAGSIRPSQFSNNDVLRVFNE